MYTRTHARTYRKSRGIILIFALILTFLKIRWVFDHRNLNYMNLVHALNVVQNERGSHSEHGSRNTWASATMNSVHRWQGTIQLSESELTSRSVDSRRNDSRWTKLSQTSFCEAHRLNRVRFVVDTVGVLSVRTICVEWRSLAKRQPGLHRLFPVC